MKFSGISAFGYFLIFSSAFFQPLLVQAESSLRAHFVSQDEEGLLPADPYDVKLFGWTNGSTRQTEFPLATKYFTGEFLLDSNAVYSFNNPRDHTLIGSSSSGRTGEIQVQHMGIGGDFHYLAMRGRILTLFGMYSTMTPQQDATSARGQWNAPDAHRNILEAFAGYHFNILNGLNLDVGTFQSFMGVASYYNYDNWMYQASLTVASVPWYMTGVRAQLFPNTTTQLELWLVNGWQSYAMFNDAPGLGASFAWRPNSGFVLVTNAYTGHDTLNLPSRLRWHSNNTVQVKYLDRPESTVSKAAFSFSFDVGCETGGGAGCFGSSVDPAQYFLGFALYNRLWFLNDRFALTAGIGGISNPGRYALMIPPINGATSGSGTPYFTANPGDEFMAWDTSLTFDYLPFQWVTLRLEYVRREAGTPYFAGPGGVTPNGGNQGTAGSAVAGFTPDLQRVENRINAAFMIRI